MRKALLTGLAVLAIGGAATGVLVAKAQPAPPPASVDAPAPPHPNWMGGMRHGPEDGRWMHGRRMDMQRTFALIYRQEDRKLTPPDVQKIAEGFLLWNGNHSWKVVDVAAAPDGSIGFALATQEGSVIARFSMDPHTARVTRAG